mmetsp:Transcript_5785/g.14033  ORF Transcript_5785/g.14033 Transcript_5785/m.14033 type:complete len:109 (-) Transcript_5785:462-788(-)
MVATIVACFLARKLRADTSFTEDAESRPVVGSSSNRMLGRVMRYDAIAVRLFCPPEHKLTSLPPHSFNPRSLITVSTLSGVGFPERCAANCNVSLTVSAGSRVGFWFM